MGIYNLNEAREITGKDTDTLLKMLSLGHLSTLVKPKTLGAAVEVIPAGVKTITKSLGETYAEYEFFDSKDDLFKRLLVDGCYKTEFVDLGFLVGCHEEQDSQFWVGLDDILFNGCELEDIEDIFFKNNHLY